MKRGFTLIELLIVVAIVAVMAAFAVIRFSGGQTSARDTRRTSDIHQYQNAIEIYANANNGLYPVRTTTINPKALCGTGNPLGNIPCTSDPTGTTNYQYNTNAAGTQYVLWATLEKPNPAQVFYVCSNGFSGNHTVTGFTPTNGTCP